MTIPIASELKESVKTQLPQANSNIVRINSWVKPGVIFGLICLLISLGVWQGFFSHQPVTENPLIFAVLPIKPIGSRNWTEALAAGMDAEL